MILNFREIDIQRLITDIESLFSDIDISANRTFLKD